MSLLDSGAVVGFLDRDDPFHAAAEAWMRRHAGQDTLIVSAITYAELLTGVALGHHDRELVRGFFRDLVDDIKPADARCAERAASIRAEASLKLPDALILATGALWEVDTVVTSDDRWSTVRIGLEIEALAAS